jgi:iron complex outermembrane receptor protein
MLAVLGGAAAAQEAASDTEIIVTAQKRQQALQDVPISITVFDAAAIERQNIDSFVDYAVKTPNIGFVNRGTRSETRIAIRGVAPISTGGSANLTGIFIDEFNVAPNISTRTADPGLFDVSQIEILKGPQGTFFGRNVVAGAISIASKKPNLEEFEAEARVEVGEFETRKVRGAFSAPLVENVLGARVLAYWDQSDGFLDNSGPAGVGNATENYGGKIALRWQMSPKLTTDLSLLYSDQSQELPTFVPGGFPSSSITLLNNFLPASGRLPRSREGFYPTNTDRISTDLKLPSSNQTLTAIGRFEYAFGEGLSLSGVAGLIDNEFRSEGEGDFTELPSFTIRRDEEITATSGEVRLAKDGERFDWLLGALIAADDFKAYQNSIHLASDPLRTTYDTAFFFLGGAAAGIIPGAPRAPLPGFARFVPSFAGGPNSSVGFFENVEQTTETRSWAVFGEASMDLTDRLAVSLGGRYSSDEIEGSRLEGPLMAGLAPRPSLRGASKSFEDFSPRATATFDITPDATLYAVASRGYRSGGFNTTPGDPDFDKETLTNYEIGLKGDVGGRLRYALTGFMMDWENTQVRAQDVITQRQVILNAEGSDHDGFELELEARPIEALTIGLAYGYVDAKFRDFRNARDLDGNALDATGFPVPLSPENTFSGNAQWDVELPGDWVGYLRAEYSYVDETREDVSRNNRRLNPSYELVNFRVGVDSERWTAQVFVENALDEVYRFGTSNLETFFSGAQVIVGEPRRVGVVLSARY